MIPLLCCILLGAAPQTAPASKTALTFTVTKSYHGFWDTQTRILVPTYLALTAADAAATEHIWNRTSNFREANPLVPSTRAGRVAYFAGTAGAVIGAAYLLHRTGHRKLEKTVLWLGCAAETQASAWTFAHP